MMETLTTQRRRSRPRDTTETQQPTKCMFVFLFFVLCANHVASYAIPSLSVSHPLPKHKETSSWAVPPPANWVAPPQQQRRVLPTTEAWARKYTTVEALRRNFGGNKNSVWGDLDANSARKLYKTLLPKALLELHQYYSHMLQQKEPPTAELQAVATDLAPLAYHARVAAKLYTRERCRLPERVAANLYDGFRQWRRYGKFQMHGMSYEQVWDKYAHAIGSEANSDEDEQVIAAKIGLKILERACATNPFVDHLVLKEDEVEDPKAKLTTSELKKITAQLEDDVRQLLWPVVLEGDNSSSVAYADDEEGAKHHVVTRYRRLRQLAKMKHGLGRLSSPFDANHVPVRPISSLPSRRQRPWQDRVRH